MTPQATRYIQVVDERTVAEDLFSFDAFVVTIKTGARPYGAISKQFVAHYPTVPIADVSHGNSSAPIASRPTARRGCTAATRRR